MKEKRRSKGMGRVYKENGVFYLQYTTNDHKRKAMILREDNGDKITEERRAESVAKKFLEDQKKLKDIETREEYLEEKAKLKKLKARMTISFDDAFTLAQQKPRRKAIGEHRFLDMKQKWHDFATFVKDKYHLQTVDQVEASHAEAYMMHLREHGRYIIPPSRRRKVSHRTKDIKFNKCDAKLRNSSINLYLKACKYIFARLLPDLGFTMEENPFYRIKLMNNEQINREVFTENELKLIFQNPPPLLRGLFTIGICTGLRLGDVATLRWDEIDDFNRNSPEFLHHEITRTTHKTNTVVHIPIEHELADYLSEQIHVSGDQEYILPEAAQIYTQCRSKLSYRIRSYLHSLGIKTQTTAPGCTRKQSIKDFHSLRHCFCYYAGLRGVPLPVVQSIVGHMDSSMTRHYQNHADKQARMRGVAMMQGLTLGKAVNISDPNALLRQNIMEYVRTASNIDILKLNVFIAQLEDSKKTHEVKMLN